MSGFSVKQQKLVLVGCAVMCWALWKARNASCFQNNQVADPMTISYSIVYWIDHLGLLQKKDARRVLRENSFLI